MENKIEKLSSKIYSPALMLSLVVALAAIMTLTFGGDRYLVLKLKYAAWDFFPLCILFCYIFNAPIFVPLMDYFLDGKKDVVGLKYAYKRVMPQPKLFYAVAVSSSIALVMFEWAYVAYEHELTVKVLEQQVCITENMLYRRNSDCTFY